MEMEIFSCHFRDLWPRKPIKWHITSHCAIIMDFFFFWPPYLILIWWRHHYNMTYSMEMEIFSCHFRDLRPQKPIKWRITSHFTHHNVFFRFWPPYWILIWWRHHYNMTYSMKMEIFSCHFRDLRPQKPIKWHITSQFTIIMDFFFVFGRHIGFLGDDVIIVHMSMYCNKSTD